MKQRPTFHILLAAVVWPITMLGGQSAAGPAMFQATPLVDFAHGQTYFGFGGQLYTDPATGADTNAVPPQHDRDGKAIAASIRPLDADGKPSPSGKIGVVGIGMSTWTAELCNPGGARGVPCNDYAFIPAITRQSGFNPAVVIADCAHAGWNAFSWVDNLAGNYTYCLRYVLPLAAADGGGGGLTARQVEVILWLNADDMQGVHPCPVAPGYVCGSISAETACTVYPGVTSINPMLLHAYHAVPTRKNPEACLYEQYVGMMARFLKSVFPNAKMLFLHSRIYGGYATEHLNPEPFAYEYGFATKWVVSAQARQIATGKVTDPTAGDLNYRNGTAPWIAWGPYWWAAGATPCRHCQIPGQAWLESDLSPEDWTHPSPDGVAKVARSMVSFYMQSPLTPWFRR